MRILLLCSAFNGLTQRVWIELCADGLDVAVQIASTEEEVRRAVAVFRPELIICPFLRERVPDDVWRACRTIIIHPGPLGDRGPSSLDWAISLGAREWGVTAIQAVAEFDAGPVWATRAFPMPEDPPRKSTLYNGPVADAAVELVREVVAKAADPLFVPEPVDHRRAGVPGQPRPAMRAADRAFCWTDPTSGILRRIRAADGSPGVRCRLAGLPVRVYDARPGTAIPGASAEPGTIVGRRHGAVLVRTGDGGVWIGQVRVDAGTDWRAVPKLPAASVLEGRMADVPDWSGDGYQEISYRRSGPVGVLSFEFYNGAMTTDHCRRLAEAVRFARAQDTTVLVLRGGEVFSTGLHLGVIEADPHPATEAWHNINAIDDVCREIIECTGQLVVATVSGNAGAGGVMLALGADRVVLRAGVVLNPHYRTMGLHGSEYWTYLLPRRVGPAEAARLTTDCTPVGAAEATRIGLADAVLAGDRAEFDEAALRYARELADDSTALARLLAAKQAHRAADEDQRPLETYRTQELAEMTRDLFDDRNGFAAARHAFVTHARRPRALPPAIAAARSVTASAAS